MTLHLPCSLTIPCFRSPSITAVPITTFSIIPLAEEQLPSELLPAFSATSSTASATAPCKAAPADPPATLTLLAASPPGPNLVTAPSAVTTAKDTAKITTDSPTDASCSTVVATSSLAAAAGSMGAQPAIAPDASRSPTLTITYWPAPELVEEGGAAASKPTPVKLAVLAKVSAAATEGAHPAYHSLDLELGADEARWVACPEAPAPIAVPSFTALRGADSRGIGARCAAAFARVGAALASMARPALRHRAVPEPAAANDSSTGNQAHLYIRTSPNHSKRTAGIASWSVFLRSCMAPRTHTQD